MPSLHASKIKPPCASRRPLAAAIAAAWLMGAGAAWAESGQGAGQGEEDLTRLSLEELAEVQITSVSRQPELLRDAASTVYVITAEDIRRSGAISLPEVLRLAPNLNVAQIDNGNYAITARGFNSMETSNKLLVLVDGRSIYTTLYSGVPWDTHEVPLQEIERIEVISGPGGTLYGVNAVNGVINIITRTAFESQGALVTAAAGPEEGRVTARYGGRFGEAGAFRVYVDAAQRDENITEAGLPARDELEGVQAGFRADWGRGAHTFTLQGDIYDRRVFEDTGRGADINGFNVLGRWRYDFSSGSNLQVQAYYDSNDRDEVGLDSSERTVDLFVQHGFAWGERHNVIWGGGYRQVDSEFLFPPGSVAVLDPANQTLRYANVFVQDQIRLGDGLQLTVGLKAEDSSYAGLEWLPSVRLGWTASDRAFFWASAARAVRTPSRIDRELTFPGFLEGGDFRAETLNAYEIGYRGRPSERTSVSVSAYYNDYDDLRTVDIDPLTIFPLRLANTARGTVHGVEAWATWDPTDRWRLTASVAWLDKDLELDPGSQDISGIASGGDDPTAYAKLRSQINLTDRLELDVGLRAYDRLAMVDGYVEADARLGWRVTDRLEVSLAGRNLLNDRHVESDDAGRRFEVGRSVWLALRWKS